MAVRRFFGNITERKNSVLDVRELQRILSWKVRNTFTFSPPVYRLSRYQPDLLLNKLNSQDKQRFKTLIEKYPTQNWSTACSEQDYQESLYILDLCDQYLSQSHISEKIARTWILAARTGTIYRDYTVSAQHHGMV